VPSGAHPKRTNKPGGPPVRLFYRKVFLLFTIQVMKRRKYKETHVVLKMISTDRTRTNLLKGGEQKLLAYLVQRMPRRINSDMLTFTGFLGTLVILLSFILAAQIDRNWLLLAIAGFAINWFGDSLDGRLAIFRNQSRRWYGFALDLSVDWITTILIGTGFYIYAGPPWRILGFVFVVLYGWAMISALLRYKITGEYSIDSGLFGPTEVRIMVSLILITEVLLPGSIIYLSALACLVLLMVNLGDFIRILRAGDAKDRSEKREQAKARKNEKLVNFQ